MGIMCKYQWTDKMSEISGFGAVGDEAGKNYEAACRAMVIAGAEWFEQNPDADLNFEQYKEVTGLTFDETPDMKTVQNVMNEAVGGDCSVAMMHAASNHLLFISKNGWNKYVEEMEHVKE